jgi:hypothetical protein
VRGCACIERRTPVANITIKATVVASHTTARTIQCGASNTLVFIYYFPFQHLSSIQHQLRDGLARLWPAEITPRKTPVLTCYARPYRFESPTSKE